MMDYDTMVLGSVQNYFGQPRRVIILSSELQSICLPKVYTVQESSFIGMLKWEL